MTALQVTFIFKQALILSPLKKYGSGSCCLLSRIRCKRLIYVGRCLWPKSGIYILLLYFFESLIEIGDEIVDMLRTDRQTDCAGIDVLLGKFGFVELRVGGRRRMDDKTFDVGDIGEKRKYFERVDKTLRRRAAAFEFDGKYRAGSVGKILLVEGMIGMIGQRRMVDFLYLGMARQIFGDLNGIGHMTRSDSVSSP